MRSRFDTGPASRRSARIGKRIRRARETAGLTQTDLGKLVGIEVGTVSAWERGQILNPPIATLLAIMAATGGPSIEALLGETSHPSLAIGSQLLENIQREGAAHATQ